MKFFQSDSTFSFIVKAVWPYRWYLFLQFLTSVIWASGETLGPLLLKEIVNHLGNVTSSTIISDLSLYLALYWGLGLTIHVNFRLYDWITLKTKPFIKQRLFAYMTNHAMHHSHEYYQHQFTGSITNKINNVASQIPSLLNFCIDSFFAYVLAIFLTIGAAWSVNIKFAVAMISWVTISLIFSYFMSGKAQRISHDAAEVKSKMIGYVADIISNMMTIRLFARRPFEKRNFNHALQEFVKTEEKRHRFSLYTNLINGTSFAMYNGICILFLINGFQEGTVTAGDFVLILTLNLKIIDVTWRLTKEMAGFNEELGTVIQGLQIIHTPLSLKDMPNTVPLKPARGEIIFDNITFHYKGTSPLFKNFSVSIPAHQKVGLVGYSGSGKTTFVNLILRLYDLQAGRILIDGQDIKNVTQDSLREAIAMIPQDSILFNRTLLENLRYGKVDATDAQVYEAARKAHAHEFIMNSLDGYQSMVGERGIKLSGGQRQRIAIARAILKNAPILILDEATNQLDSVTEHLIQESLEQAMAGRTSIVVAHRLSTLLRMDRILVFDQGKIIQDGTHEVLLSQPGLYKTLWDTQVGGLVPSEKEE